MEGDDAKVAFPVPAVLEFEVSTHASAPLSVLASTSDADIHGKQSGRAWTE